MAMRHASPGERIDIGPLRNTLADAKSGALFKTDGLEVLRLVLPAGKAISEHTAPGEIIVQCIEGCVEFTAMGRTVELTSGTMLYLPVAEPHALRAVEDSSLLVFIMLRGKVSSTE